jgi:hypothetical protein
VFGSTFVVVKEAILTLPLLAFVGWRFVLGAGVLFLVARPRGRCTWLGGRSADGLLFIEFATQTAGLASTSASNSAPIMLGIYVVRAFSPPEEADLVAAEGLSEAH